MAGTCAGKTSRPATGRSAESADRALADTRKRSEPGHRLRALGHGAGERAERLSLGRLRLVQRDRRALVAGHAGFGVERNPGEEWDAELLGDPLAPGVTEDRGRP